MKSCSIDTQKLKKWFQREKRAMPWREDPTPYRVWVSEVMLQQTQVAVVIPYFERWMKAFPTVEDLAAAPIEDVIKLWEGLGYYSRARNLHKGAQTIVERFSGLFPHSAEALSEIKGLGPYTIGAIRSFAFQQKAAAVDGNVMRVLARYFLIEEEVTKTKTQKQLRQLAEDILPDEEPWVVSEALIELGATICTKKAKCLNCPIKMGCQANRQRRVDELPKRAKRIATTLLYREVPIIQCDEHFLLRKVSEGEIMSDLHEFPYLDGKEEAMDRDQLQMEVYQYFGLAVDPIQALSEVQHSFTRYRATLRPTLFRAKYRGEAEGFIWVEREQLLELPFSAGHRRILTQTLRLQ